MLCQTSQLSQQSDVNNLCRCHRVPTINGNAICSNNGKLNRICRTIIDELSHMYYVAAKKWTKRDLT